LTPPLPFINLRHGKNGFRCKNPRWVSVPASRSLQTTTKAREDARPTSRLKSSSLLATRAVYCGDKQSHKVIVALTVKEILDEQLPKKLV
jgi:hypothetical protein